MTTVTAFRTLAARMTTGFLATGMMTTLPMPLRVLRTLLAAALVTAWLIGLALIL